MLPLPGERILFESEANRLTLSSHRVRLDTGKGGNARLVSIMLEELCSCEITRSHYPGLLLLALFFVVAGYACKSQYREDDFLYIGITVAVVMVIFYLASRNQVLSLESAGGSIKVSTSSMNFDEARDFIDRVEAAKNERYLLVRPT